VELRDLLRRQAREGVAVLVSSHILADLEEVADRVVFVDHGVTVGEHRLDALPRSERRTWRVRALDPNALLVALDRNRIPHGEPSPAGVEVELTSDSVAADVLAGLVRDGVPVVSFAPVGGALEAAYLQLTETQR